MDIDAQPEAGPSRRRSASPSTSTTSICSTPDPQLVEDYEELMTSMFPPNPSQARSIPPQHQQNTANAAGVVDDSDSDADNGSRPMTKAEKQNAKKKRRKERERMAKEGVVKAERQEKEMEQMAKPVAFRLYSSCPTKDVSLLPAKEEYEIPANPRLCSLPPMVVDTIHRYAAEAAIQAKDLTSTSGFAGVVRRRGKRTRVDEYRIARPPPRLLVGRLRPPRKATTSGSRSHGAIPKLDLLPANNNNVLPPPVRVRSRRKKRSYERPLPG